MHYLVRLIVDASDSETAKGQAHCAIDTMLEEHEFDWYREEGDANAWEDCWKPVRFSSKQGQAWVQDAMATQLSEFKLSMQAVRHMVAGFTDEQIFDEDFDQDNRMHLSRYYFSKASGYHANACVLYDTNGTAIPNNTDLRYCTEKPDDLWVVQVDCHN
ncbi:hypothetical protein EOL96_06145 [Candidatus Saccharibacteria bacterium]|nr:hypothetical protein [Candidatus Saccharibacteria bacterium]